MEGKNMSMVDRMAERLRSSELGVFIDEADVYDLCKQAIQKAFFEPRVTGDGYNRKHIDPLLVEVARGAFAEAVRPLIQDLVKEAAKTPEFQKLIADGLSLAVISEGRNFGPSLVASAVMQASHNNETLLRQAIRQLVMQP